MTDPPETPASPDPLSPAAAPIDSPPTAEKLTEVSLTETRATVTEVMVTPQTPMATRHPPLTSVQLALRAGWTMAVLYGNSPPMSANGPKQLPTVDELPPGQRQELELGRLHHILKDLAHLPGFAGSGLPTTVPAHNAAEAQLEALNLAILEALAATQPENELAYELGRSLRDTVNPPQDRNHPPDTNEPGSLVPALSGMLAHGRIAKLQEWLATLSPQFPKHTAAIVAASLGRWSDFAAVTISTGTKKHLEKKNWNVVGANPYHRWTNRDLAVAAAAMRDHLLPQGDLWLMLLSGARATTGLLSPEGYVAAGEAALRRSASILRRIVRHNWFAWLIVGAALGGLLYLSIQNLDGAAKVWTSIATVGGTLGIASRSIASTVSRLTAEAERPIFAMAEEDAMAWAITTLPPVSLRPLGVRHLRKAGIAPTSELGRI